MFVKTTNIYRFKMKTTNNISHSLAKVWPTIEPWGQTSPSDPLGLMYSTINDFLLFLFYKYTYQCKTNV